MIASSAKAGAPTSHPRRPPTHLSVSLRRDSPPKQGNTETRDGGINPTRIFPARQTADESNESKESDANLQKWFERSNTHPEAGYTQNFQDNEPPYIPPHNDANPSESSLARGRKRPIHQVPGAICTTTTGSSTDDFRSVIDDLTIENKKLKERLRKYNQTHSTPLEKGRLFEVKIHTLPARKKRELEDLLRGFASGLDDSVDDESPKDSGKGLLPYPLLEPLKLGGLKHSTSTSTSNSRPFDSAYASMHASGGTSTSTLNIDLEKKLSNQQIGARKEHRINSFLHNIPEGLLPKHLPVMTERQKKKIVVKKLEQLFTGKAKVVIEHSQPLQQQEISRIAFEADRVADGDLVAAIEGIREARILPHVLEGVQPQLPEESSRDIQDPMNDSSDESPDRLTPEQRPTRPLDLDPDRAQIPSENADYLRHLGLSMPQLASDDSMDSNADTEGWIYLNLLVNMAQLHIINVTPDFVRAAVSDVSEKFQLSSDGKKVRWRGGTRRRNMSSDSGAGSTPNLSAHESDSPDDRRKRCKLEGGSFSSVPIHQRAAQRTMKSSNPLYYKPLFHRKALSSRELESSDGSDSGLGYEARNGSSTGANSRSRSGVTRSGSWVNTKKRDHGPIVFYSGAKFCTDLSGDPGDIETPLHITGVGKDGYSNHSQNALGCQPRKDSPLFARTTSGSSLPYRPFKEPDDQAGDESPDMLIDVEEDEMDFDVEKSVGGTPSTPFQDFDATGLGGTQPADHFALRVKTKQIRTTTNNNLLSKFSAPNLVSKNFVHVISRSSLAAFHQQSPQNSADSITADLPFMNTVSSSPKPNISAADLPIKMEIISTQFVQLQPSKLPRAMGYYAATSDSEDDSSFSSSSESRPRDRYQKYKSVASRSDFHSYLQHRPCVSFGGHSRSSEKYLSDDEELEGDEGDESIDMLAQARELDPEMVARREQEFQMQMDEENAAEEALARSSVATVDEKSGYESLEGSSSDA